MHIVLRENKKEGENKMCKGRKKGLRGLTNGTRTESAKGENKILEGKLKTNGGKY